MHWVGERFVAQGQFMKRFRTILQETAAIVPEFPNGDAHVMFTTHGYLIKLGVAPDDMPKPDNIAGLANVGNVCNTQYGSRSIVERGRGGKGMGLIRVFLHEVGHNLGMGHNGSYEKKLEGIPAGLCAISKPRKPIMRYESDDWVPPQFTWTICNRCDLLRNYHKKMTKNGEYCLDRA